MRGRRLHGTARGHSPRVSLRLPAEIAAEVEALRQPAESLGDCVRRLLWELLRDRRIARAGGAS